MITRIRDFESKALPPKRRRFPFTDSPLPPYTPSDAILGKLFHPKVVELKDHLRFTKRGYPFVSVAYELIIFGDGPSGGIVGIPTLDGGVGRVQIFIGGIEMSDCATTDRTLVFGLGQSAGAQPLRISQQTIGRGVATFDLIDYDGTITIQLGQSCLIQENGQRLLVGCITDVTPEIFDGADFVVYHVTVNDKASIFDHRVVLAQVYLAGTDAADIIRDLFTNPQSCNPPLQQEGITLNNVPASLGAITADIPMNLWYVPQLLDAIMTDVVGEWWVDTTSDLHAQNLPDIGAAPFGLDATTRNFFRANMKTSLTQYRTKQYVVTDRVVTPSASSMSITGTPVTETWTIPQQAAVDQGFLFGSIITNFSMLKITSLKVNGVAQPYYLGVLAEPINYQHVWWYFPQTPYLIPPSPTNNNGLPDPPLTSANPVPGDVIEISYIAPQQAQVKAQDPLAPTFGQCGSGVYENVNQVKNVDTQEGLAALAQSLIDKFGELPKTLSFQTDRPGLAVGQRLSVNLPKLDLSVTTLLITSVDSEMMSGQLDFGSRFRHTVQATNTQDLGNWLKWYERLVRRTENAIPVARYEEARFWQTGSVAEGVIATNPYVVVNTGRVYLAFAIVGVAAVDQDLTLDIISAAQGSILGGPVLLTIPAGSTALVKIDQFTDDPAPFFLYRDDVLTATATYTATGGSPVNAARLTLGLRISY